MDTAGPTMVFTMVPRNISRFVSRGAVCWVELFRVRLGWVGLAWVGLKCVAL